MIKKVTAMLLAALMIMSLAGCGKKKREIIRLTLSTEDSEAILAAAGITLPDVTETVAAGTTVRYLSWYDQFHNYSDDEIINTGYFTFTEKYGCEVEWLECGGYFTRFDDLANLVLAGTPPDFFPSGTNATATYPLMCIKGMFQPINDYVDYTDPLWQGIAGVADDFRLGSDWYTIVTHTSTREVVTYNRRVIDEWGFDDPSELYFNDEWTWDVLYDMCMDFSDDDEKRYGLDGNYPMLFIQSTGQYYIERDEDGKYFSNTDSPEIERAQGMLYDLVKNNCSYHEGDNYWPTREPNGKGVKEGLCLFWVCDPTVFTDTVENVNAVWGDIEAGELMFCPLPRDPNGDGNYYLFSQVNGYNIVAGAENPEGVGLLAACERFKIIDPTVVNIDRKQLEETYLWTDEMLAMYDTCAEIAAANPRTIPSGNLTDKLNGLCQDYLNCCCRYTNKSTWAQIKEKNGDAFDYYIEEINSMIDEMSSEK